MICVTKLSLERKLLPPLLRGLDWSCPPFSSERVPGNGQRFVKPICNVRCAVFLSNTGHIVYIGFFTHATANAADYVSRVKTVLAVPVSGQFGVGSA